MVHMTQNELRSKPWSELQGLAKLNGLKANQKKDVLIEELAAMPNLKTSSTSTSSKVRSGATNPVIGQKVGPKAKALVVPARFEGEEDVSISFSTLKRLGVYRSPERVTVRKPRAPRKKRETTKKLNVDAFGPSLSGPVASGSGSLAPSATASASVPGPEVEESRVRSEDAAKVDLVQGTSATPTVVCVDAPASLDRRARVFSPVKKADALMTLNEEMSPLKEPVKGRSPKRRCFEELTDIDDEDEIEVEMSFGVFSDETNAWPLEQPEVPSSPKKTPRNGPRIFPVSGVKRRRTEE
ncbi:uncharacterized protein BXZ73DRAFT_97629 [Epithele typhae]|uniref:uncharacterized protein n=1 Tax=Epithele typhae TaxID=378194 RepID=UPI0020074FD9|nr:uncharacterized protein BXZ73DRAFT_97629 [Epithele typhae]KAH9942209.1 hypothetical protein BXZ73DRAFT_97629 [Epithele typhae]